VKGTKVVEETRGEEVGKRKRLETNGENNDGVKKAPKECQAEDRLQEKEVVAGRAEGKLQQTTTVSMKASKADDASVHVKLWDSRIYQKIKWLHPKTGKPQVGRLDLVDQVRGDPALIVIRRLCHGYWKRKVERDFNSWISVQQTEIRNDPELRFMGLKACARAWSSSWWEWDGGSSLLFWRWEPAYRDDVVYGCRPWFTGTPPDSKDAQPAYDCKATRLKVRKKVGKVVGRSYVVLTALSLLLSLMYMFDVPKGDDNVHTVYDGSKSGLNDALWAPWFALPTVMTMSRTLMAGDSCSDNDYGDMFLNFHMHEELQEYAGIDLTQLFPEKIACGEDGRSGAYGVGRGTRWA
jgi:hypothetical protein